MFRRVGDQAQEQDCAAASVGDEIQEGTVYIHDRGRIQGHRGHAHAYGRSCRRLGTLFIDLDVRLVDDLRDEGLDPFGIHTAEVGVPAERLAHSQAAQYRLQVPQCAG